MSFTSDPNFYVRSKSFFLIYPIEENIDLNNFKSLLLSVFSIPEIQLNFFILKTSNTNQIKPNSIIVLLEFKDKQYIRNNKETTPLTLHLNKKKMEGVYFPIRGNKLALTYLLELQSIDSNSKYLSNYETNIITKISKNLIGFDLNDKKEYNLIANKVINQNKTYKHSTPNPEKNQQLKQLTPTMKETFRVKAPILLRELQKPVSQRKDLTNERASLERFRKGYLLTEKQQDILEWCKASIFKKRTKQNIALPKEYLNPDSNIYLTTKEE